MERKGLSDAVLSYIQRVSFCPLAKDQVLTVTHVRNIILEINYCQ